MASITRLLVRFAVGDREAFDALVRRLDARRPDWLNRRRAALRTGGMHDTDDLAQRVYGTLWREVAAGRHRTTLTNRDDLADLLRLLAHQTATRLRRYDSQQCRDPGRTAPLAADPPAPNPGPDTHAAYHDTLADLSRRLTGRQRRVVGLRLDGLADAEIAARLGCSERTVYRELVEVRAVVGRLLDVSPPAAGEDV